MEEGCLSQGTGGADYCSPFNNLRNKRQVENGQPDHQHQSATADQQRKQQSVCCSVALIHCICAKNLYELISW